MLILFFFLILSLCFKAKEVIIYVNGIETLTYKRIKKGDVITFDYSNNHDIILNTPNSPDNQNSLINSNENHINNITPNINYNLNNNYLVPNNIAVDNLNNKSLGNLSNSGNINTSSSGK